MLPTARSNVSAGADGRGSVPLASRTSRPNPLARQFSLATFTALGSVSMATADEAPSNRAATVRIPEPVPMSSTATPGVTICSIAVRHMRVVGW